MNIPGQSNSKLHFEFCDGDLCVYNIHPGLELSTSFPSSEFFFFGLTLKLERGLFQVELFCISDLLLQCLIACVWECSCVHSAWWACFVMAFLNRLSLDVDLTCPIFCLSFFTWYITVTLSAVALLWLVKSYYAAPPSRPHTPHCLSVLVMNLVDRAYFLLKSSEDWYHYQVTVKL